MHDGADLLTLLNRLSANLRPAYGPRAADAGQFPDRYDPMAFGMDMYMRPEGSACCTYGALGCPCNCSRRKSFNAWECMGRGRGAYAMVDSDWPGLDWTNGVGPGPYIQAPDVFPMTGRANLVPWQGSNYGPNYPSADQGPGAR